MKHSSPCLLIAVYRAPDGLVVPNLYSRVSLMQIMRGGLLRQLPATVSLRSVPVSPFADGTSSGVYANAGADPQEGTTVRKRPHCHPFL